MDTDMDTSTPLTATESPEGLLDLRHMSADDREELYQHKFSQYDVPIEKIRLPSLSYQYPELEEEIHTAYVKYATFVFKVWVNYDAAEGRFFIDEPRLSDCGKLVTSPKVDQHLDQIGARYLRYRNVLFDLGTPFRTLARFRLEVGGPMKPNGAPSVHVFVADASNRQHLDFMEYVQDVKGSVEQGEVTEGKDYFDIKDLEKLALSFKPMPTRRELTRMQYYHYDGLWVTKYSNNEGYIRFRSKD